MLMQGGTGLGKRTYPWPLHMKPLKKGYGVIYGSAQKYGYQFRKERFQKDNEQQDTNQLMLQCDLLIIDDLGTEFSTSFVTAAIYNIKYKAYDT